MEMLQMRSFKPEGIDQARVWLGEARKAFNGKVTPGLLDSPTFTQPAGSLIPAEIFGPGAFNTKLSLAKALDKAIKTSGLDEKALENDQGFWSWMAIQFADRFVTTKGSFGEDALWVYEYGNWRKVYRHKMAPLWLVYRSHRENPQCLQAVLSIPVNKTGEVFEQMMSRKWIVLSPGIMTLVTKLYFEEQKGILKKGSGGKGEGAARRLSTVLDQLRLTYDIEDLSWDALAEMLPNDFKRFV
ncbi:hypothetical protein [Pseudomonas cichorii]|uniref:Uncharacterized protein n=1 Tax=Pseudomonas cichorii TaxID=36746 RepID=A0ABQ1DJK7_PSECI|nr:hypothetical protein [Pseudomonas cichorii]QVE15985.1 hypothetical protein KGD89_19170 [Pseudomonas cichorii]GFM91114.1 hypothetical protein PSCICP_10860 [Pseudomonas cichorii]SDN23212.1 hypothetical protein SAMN05216599_101330 [Pseudomonas cichorii]